MLLQRLCEYADRIEAEQGLPPPLYRDTAIRYIVALNQDGTSASQEPIDTADVSQPSARKGTHRPAPYVVRSSGTKPMLFSDDSDYTFGIPGDKPERAGKRHEAYLDLVRRCGATTHESSVYAILHFLKSNPLAHLTLPADFDENANVTFRVGEIIPIDLPSVRAFWAAEHTPDSTREETTVMQCLVCGNTLPVLSRLQSKLQKVPGGQTAGTSLISANEDAFGSYGLKNSLIAPTCARCGERFTKAANALIQAPDSHIRIQNVIYLFWTREPVAMDPWGGFITEPKAEQVQALLDSVRTGKRAGTFADTAFYATALSGSGGRAVVRDWIDTTVGQAQENLARWFTRQRITDEYGQPGRPLGLFGLAGATVRELRDIQNHTTQALIRSALTGGQLPLDLLFQAVRRNRAEGRITYPRAALIKLVLTSRGTFEEEAMAGLDTSNANAGYRCGRLFAVLEEAQRQALPGIKSTIVDRFFGSASSAPLTVFARLIRGAQPHLAKLQRDRRGAYIALQGRIEEILAGLDSFPRTLALEDQALFSLGYYHQRAHDRAQAREAAAARKALGKQPAEADLDSTILTDEVDQ